MGKSIKNEKEQNSRERIDRKIIDKEEQGITLITLVITILIIIILAGITINASLGDNGLLRQAQNAKDLAESTTLETGEKMNKVLQEYANIMAEDEGGGIQEPEEDTTPPTVRIAEGAITQNSITINVTANDSESGLASEKPYIYYLNGAEYERSNSSSCTFTGLTASTQYTIKVEVYNGAGIKGEDSVIITTEDLIFNSKEIKENAQEFYGAEVLGYSTDHSETSEAVQKWRIFYAGTTPSGNESNIYLIADDCILGAAAPTSTAGNSLRIGDTNFSVSFRNILNDYSGSSWIINNTNNGAREWLDVYLNEYPTSTNDNIKAVAYLMDTNVWNIYAGNTAKYAIGGPTIELFCASYEDTHPSRYLQCGSVTSYGYLIKWSDGEYETEISGLIPDEFNKIYIKSDASGSNSIWLASPAVEADADYDWNLFYTNSIGRICTLSQGAVYGLGLRPIVCLKSEVQLERIDAYTFKIIE